MVRLFSGLRGAPNGFVYSTHHRRRQTAPNGFVYSPAQIPPPAVQRVRPPKTASFFQNTRSPLCHQPKWVRLFGTHHHRLQAAKNGFVYSPAQISPPAVQRVRPPEMASFFQNIQPPRPPPQNGFVYSAHTTVARKLPKWVRLFSRPNFSPRRTAGAATRNGFVPSNHPAARVPPPQNGFVYSGHHAKGPPAKPLQRNQPT
jgi:hypothetical protein